MVIGPWGVPYLCAGFALLAFARCHQLSKRDFMSAGKLTTPAFVCLFAAYTGMTAAIIAAALFSPQTASIPAPVAAVAGGAMIVAGLVFYLSARLKIRSFRATWALRVDELITSGPYRLSRNPQVVGLVGILLGISIARRSIVAIVLSAIYVWMSAEFIRLEEAVLLRRFGAAYQRYCARVRRVL